MGFTCYPIKEEYGSIAGHDLGSRGSNRSYIRRGFVIFGVEVFDVGDQKGHQN